jgi:hypothetical protein
VRVPPLPVIVGVVIDGLVNVLFVRVSVDEIVGTVTPEICNVVGLTVPPVHVPLVEVGVVIVGVVNAGLVRVLLVNVSVVALPTRVSTADGNVNVPPGPAIVEIVGEVNVLFVRV